MSTETSTETVTRAITRTGNATACPLCHADGPTLAEAQIKTGAWWHCEGCGQLWDGDRLTTVAGYAAFCAARAAQGAA